MSAKYQFILAILHLSLHDFSTTSPTIESGSGGSNADAEKFGSQNHLDSAFLEMIGLRFEGVGRIIEAERALRTAKRLKSTPSISEHIERIKYMKCSNFSSSDFYQAILYGAAHVASQPSTRGILDMRTHSRMLR
jgi:hypothetical protein